MLDARWKDEGGAAEGSAGYAARCTATRQQAETSSIVTETSLVRAATGGDRVPGAIVELQAALVTGAAAHREGWGSWFLLDSCLCLSPSPGQVRTAETRPRNVYKKLRPTIKHLHLVLCASILSN